MRKISVSTVTVVAAILLLGHAGAQGQAATAAQQPAAPNSTPKPAASKKAGTTASKTVQKPASKTDVPLTLNTQKDKVSYAIGMNVGKSLQRDAVEVDTAILLRGLKDALAGSKPLLTDEEAKAVFAAVQTELRKRQEEKIAALGEANKKEGEAFLAANKTKEGVVTLPSGLQYKVLTEGSGQRPKATDSVVCNYRGTLINETEFDSSYKRGEPATFPVTRVIKGWTEALQLMPVGSKWELFIPAELAYGSRGAAGGLIGPNATLIFEVELLSIQQPPAATPPAPAMPVAPPRAATPPPASTAPPPPPQPPGIV